MNLRSAAKLVTEPWRVARNAIEGIPFLVAVFRFNYGGTRSCRWEVDIEHGGQVITHSVQGSGQPFMDLSRFVRSAGGEVVQMRLMPLDEDGEPDRGRMVAMPHRVKAREVQEV
jgi:hypothetical protein